jgi:hypothetical protein
MKLLEYRLRPKSDYLMLAPWEELYRLTEQWKKDLLFYKDELNFFEKLLRLYAKASTPGLVQLKERTTDTFAQLRLLDAQTDQHLAHLGKIITQADNSEDLLFRTEHNVLEDNINAFLESFRLLKQNAFSAAEHFSNSAADEQLPV